MVVGATAIEDKLQDGVPDTIAHLLEAGVNVWVLTGDKVETAINIGFSCRLLNSSMVLIKVTDPTPPTTASTSRSGPGALSGQEALRLQLRRLVHHFERLVEDEALFGGLWKKKKRRKQRGSWRRSRRRSNSFLQTATVGAGAGATDEEGGLAAAEEPLLEPQPDAPALEDLQSDHLALIIDGPALACVFGDAEMERLLLRVATLCKSVVACRVSPAQKRMLVRLVKKGVRPKPITLAIGDGANDVSMMREAQIGVGISGREGKQVCT